MRCPRRIAGGTSSFGESAEPSRPRKGARPGLTQGTAAPGIIEHWQACVGRMGTRFRQLALRERESIRDDQFGPLELLDVRVAVGGHGVAEGPHEVHAARGLA